MKKDPNLSIVIPLYNEEEVLPLLLAELKKVCVVLKGGYEIIFVDDGSHDNTYDMLQLAAKKNKNIKVLRFSRNFGHQAAFNAGIDFAKGNMVVTMDGDLQHPPSLIPQFIKHAKEGYDIVIGERLNNKQNNKAREIIGRLSYKVLGAVTGLDFKNISDFNLYNRTVISTLKRLPERERFLRGMIQWVGFKKKYIPYVVEKRGAGVPKYNLKKLFNLGLSGITSFSAFPLRLSFWLGSLVMLISLFFGAYVIVDHYVNPNPLIAGWATVVILVLFIGSVQLMVLGVVGEYLYKMFNEVKGRPLYIVSQTHNIIREGVEETPYGIHKI